MVMMMIGGFTLLFLALVGFLIYLKSVVSRQKKEILEQFAGKTIIKMCSGANCFGQESLGMAQVRGNGTLLLVEDSLYFKMWMPEKVMQIYVHTIEECQIVKSHLGKTKFCPLLKVLFINREGKQDSIAWLVPDPQSWIDEIEKLKK